MKFKLRCEFLETRDNPSGFDDGSSASIPPVDPVAPPPSPTSPPPPDNGPSPKGPVDPVPGPGSGW